MNSSSQIIIDELMTFSAKYAILVSTVMGRCEEVHFFWNEDELNGVVQILITGEDRSSGRWMHHTREDARSVWKNLIAKGYERRDLP